MNTDLHSQNCLDQFCCMKRKKVQGKELAWGIRDGSHVRLKVLNDDKLVLNENEDPLNYLGSIWYCSEPSGVPYSPNQFLALDFFCRFLQQDGFNFLYECWIWQTKTSFVSVDWKLENSNYNNFYIVQYNPMKLCLFAFRGKRMMFALRMRASVIIYNLKTWGQKCALSKFP